MGLFGGGNSSTSNTTNNYNYQLDKRVTAGPNSGFQVTGKGNTVTSTDQGAVKAGAQLGSQAISSTRDMAAGALQQMADVVNGNKALAGDAISNALTLAQIENTMAQKTQAASQQNTSEALKAVQSANQSQTTNDMQKMMRYGTVLIALLILGNMVKRK